MTEEPIYKSRLDVLTIYRDRVICKGNFKTQEVNVSDIEKVTWEEGGGGGIIGYAIPVLLLKNGKRVTFPGLMSGAYNREALLSAFNQIGVGVEPLNVYYKRLYKKLLIVAVIIALVIVGMALVVRFL